MAVEKVGIYRKWLEAVPKEDGKPIPKAQWPRKRRHCWIARWYSTEGRRYGRVFETRKEAESCQRRLQDQVLLGTADKPRKVTLHEFRLEHERVMQGQVAYATLYDQKRALMFFENFIGGLTPLSKIKPRHAEAFVAYRLSTVPSVATVNKDIRTLRRIFNLAIEPRGYIAEGQNPFGRLKQRKKAKKPVRYVTVGEYRKFVNKAEDLWWKALVSLAYGSGLRRNEILNLTWADIDFEKQMIYISPKQETDETIEWEPKDHESRIAPMSDETSQFLAQMQVGADEASPYIFISPRRLERIRERRKMEKWNSQSPIVNNVRKDFDRIRCRARLAKFTLHDFRRSAITNWAKQLPIQVVQKFAGHSDMKTTEQYYIAVRQEDIVCANRVLKGFLAQTQDD